MYIMEKGDKPKPKEGVAKPKAVTKAKAKAKAKQTQIDRRDTPLKQSQKQTVKIVIGDTKPKRKYARKAKVVRPTTNIVRGQTVYLGGESDLNQVISTPVRQGQPPSQPPIPFIRPPPQPPILSSAQAPVTLDTELTAVSELVYPKARTPAFQEVQQPVPKKKTKATARKTIVKIGESIGDFIKKNLLDQPLDIYSQEPSRAVEKPRPPLVIKPESKPLKPSKAKAEEIFMEVGSPVVPSKTRKPVKGKTEVPVSVVFGREIEREEMGREDANVAPREQTATVPVEKTQDIPVKKPKKKKELIIEEGEATEKVSLQDPAPIERLRERISRDIVEETVNDVIATIETPIFSENPDFKQVIQNVVLENVPSSELDFGNRGMNELNEEGFIPVGSVSGMIEAIEKKKGGGRPKKYEDPEVAKQMKLEQTRESNKRRAEAKSKEREQMKAEDTTAKGQRLDEEWEAYLASPERTQAEALFNEFVTLDQETDSLRAMIQSIKERNRLVDESPYTVERQMPNLPKINVAQDYSPLGEYAATVFISEGGQKLALRINDRAYDRDFQSGDFDQQIGDLTSTNNFGGIKPLVKDFDTGYSDETPVLTTALFSSDAVDSSLPFLGINDIQFL